MARYVITSEPEGNGFFGGLLKLIGFIVVVMFLLSMCK